MAIKIANNATRPCRASNINSHKRLVHNTKSHQYIKEFLKNKAHFDEFQANAKAAKVELFPETMRATLKLESAFSDKGMITCVNATPAAFTPAIQLATRCELAKNKTPRHKDIDTFAVMRDPASLSDHYTQMMRILQIVNDSSIQRPDWIPAMSDNVLSMNYGLFTNIKKGESAFYFGLKNWAGTKSDPDFAKKKAVSMIENTLKYYGFANKEITEIVNSKELSDLLEGFHSLNTGNFLVFGIPREIARKALYDSYASGIPTGNDVLKVFDGIEGKERMTHHQARFVISKETMDPNSGIMMLSALDEVGVVDPFLTKNKKTPFISPFESKEFSTILPVASTGFERTEISKRLALLDKSKVFAYAVASSMPSRL